MKYEQEYYEAEQDLALEWFYYELEQLEKNITSSTDKINTTQQGDIQ